MEQFSAAVAILTVFIFSGLLVDHLSHLHLLVRVLLLQVIHDLLIAHVTVLGHAAEARRRHLISELLLVTHVLCVLHVHLAVYFISYKFKS